MQTDTHTDVSNTSDTIERHVSEAFLGKGDAYSFTVQSIRSDRPDIEIDITVNEDYVRACRTSDETIDDPACLEVGRGEASHMLPYTYRVLTFNVTSDMSHVPMARTVQGILQAAIPDIWNRFGVIDNLIHYDGKEPLFIDFWYKTLRWGPLSNVNESAHTLDGMGFLPAHILMQDDTDLDEESQLALNVDRAHRYYTQLQEFHKLPIAPRHETMYIDRREESAHRLRTHDGVSAFMQLLCSWSKDAMDAVDRQIKAHDTKRNHETSTEYHRVAIRARPVAIDNVSQPPMYPLLTINGDDIDTERLEARMRMGWDLVYGLWNKAHYTGVDEALVRFKHRMLEYIHTEPVATLTLLRVTSISEFIEKLSVSSLTNRQNLAHAVTDIFQNQAVSNLVGQTTCVNINDENNLWPDNPPIHTLSEKALLVHNGQIKAPFVSESGDVYFDVVKCVTDCR